MLRTVQVLAAVLFVLAVDGRLKYIRQRPIFPLSKQEFANDTASGDDTKLVEVQRKGDLIKWMETIYGIRVYGTVITTRFGNGMVNRMEGFRASSPKTAPPFPTLPGKEATDLLKIHWKHEGLTKVEWRNYEPELYYFPKDGVNRLVWLASYEVDWQDGVTPNNDFGAVPAYIIGLVNAHTGQVETTWNNIESAVSSIEAVIGNDKIGVKEVELKVEKEDSMCWHVDDDRRVKVYTMENKRYLSKKTVTSFICDWADDLNWDLYNFTGGYSPRNAAFKHATQFVDLWRKFVGLEVQPYRTNDSYIEIFTHYGYQIDNALFMGYFVIVGDGKDMFYPLTSLDIICHEIGHGVTKWVGGALKYYGESGAMNEAYSDVLGETCDMYYKNRTNYLIGEDIMKPGQGAAMRDMCHPARFKGLEHYSQYNDSVDLHHSSGIYNKAWCILTKTKGWDYIKAFQVFTDANLMFWSSSTTMHCGACSVENAAVDHKLSKDDVSEAFKVVGVYCALCEKSL